MQNPIQVQIFETFERHNHVRFDIGGRQNDFRIFDYHFEISVHEIKYQRDVWLVAKHIQQTNHIFVL